MKVVENGLANISSIGQMCNKVIEHTLLAQPKTGDDLWAFNIVSVANHPRLRWMIPRLGFASSQEYFGACCSE